MSGRPGGGDDSDDDVEEEINENDPRLYMCPISKQQFTDPYKTYGIDVLCCVGALCCVFAL